ncbi:hypothetical protein EBT11_09635 [bacterium]|nr:hypothetical protein [bacterium]
MKKLHTILCLFVGLGSFSCLLASSLQEQVEQETAKRDQSLKPLREAYEKSQRLVADGKSMEACGLLIKTFDGVPESLRSTPLATEVQKTLGTLEASLAGTASEQNHWPEARRRAIASLQYDPQNEKALSLLQKCDEVLRRGTVANEAVNPALTTKFFDRLNAVNTGLKEAQALRETGQLQKAEQRYESRRFMRSGRWLPKKRGIYPIWSEKGKFGRLGTTFILKVARRPGVWRYPAQ